MADTKPAYAGTPANVPGANVFDFLFSNPFQHENDFTPRARRVPKIHDDQPIFVDHASGTLHSQTQSHLTSHSILHA